MSVSSIQRRLASACCQGWRQQALVNELLIRPVIKTAIPIPGGRTGVIYGQTRLPSKSFQNLRRRMVAVGFVFTTTRVDFHESLVTLSFPEES